MVKIYWTAIKNIAKTLIKVGFKWLYNYIDKNNDGKIDKSELRMFLEDLSIENDYLFDILDDDE